MACPSGPRNLRHAFWPSLYNVCELCCKHFWSLSVTILNLGRAGSLLGVILQGCRRHPVGAATRQIPHQSQPRQSFRRNRSHFRPYLRIRNVGLGLRGIVFSSVWLSRIYAEPATLPISQPNPRFVIPMILCFLVSAVSPNQIIRHAKANIIAIVSRTCETNARFLSAHPSSSLSPLALENRKERKKEIFIFAWLNL